MACGELSEDGGPLDAKAKKDDYLLIDCPGQVELFTHNSALKGILQLLADKLDLRLVVVHLVDSPLHRRGHVYFGFYAVTFYHAAAGAASHKRCQK